MITAFLHGKADEQIYVKLPNGYRSVDSVDGVDSKDKDKNEDDEDVVGLLSRALYGLKQSPRLWQQTLLEELVKLGYKPMKSNSSIYIGELGIRGITIVIYVDDFLLIGPKKADIEALKLKLSEVFHIKDLGPCESFLGVKLIRDRKKRQIHLSQAHYADKVIKAFGLEKAAPVYTPMDVGALAQMVPYNGQATDKEIKRYQKGIGSLMYPMTQTRTDLSFTESTLCQFNSNPSPFHWKACQRAIKYYGTTKELGITLGAGETDYDLEYHGYSDSDYAGDVATRKSTSGYVFFMAGGPVSWKSSKQHVVTLSSTEAEYYALTDAAKEAKWHQAFLDEIGYVGTDVHPATIHRDNTGALDLAENPEHHGRAKHIDIRMHYIRQEVENGSIQLSYVPTADMVADGLTKPLVGVKHQKFIEQLGLEAWK